MNLTVNIAYGGSYREIWDNQYRLSVDYHGQKNLRMNFVDSHWMPDPEYPAIPYADVYFPQAASALIAAKRAVASGLTAQNVSELSPDNCHGSIFAAEFLRLSLDQYGQLPESVYPYIADYVQDQLTKGEVHALEILQPRTAQVLQLLYNLKSSWYPARHDIRLPDYRKPTGALRCEERLRLNVYANDADFHAVTLELYGDDFQQEFPMARVSDTWTVELNMPSTGQALWYRFRMTDNKKRVSWLCAAPDGIHAQQKAKAESGFRLTVFDKNFSTPEWFRHAVMYQVFPDRFAFSDDGTAEAGIQYHNNLGQHPELHKSKDEPPRWKPRSFEKEYTPDDFYGGTLQGIIQKIPYLKTLGINCLYLNPIVEARSNHRYDTSDYLRVDPILGTNEDFEVLCSVAEEAGIRIITDGVFSHTGADSIYFNRDGHYPQSGAAQMKQSPYYSWYEFKHFPDDYRCWWGFKELPEVNEKEPEWQNFVVTGENSVVRQWLRRGSSGWRLDVADELPDTVLSLIRDAAKKEKPDALILGEVWEDAVLKESYGSRRKYALGTALDSVMNYPFRTAILDFLHTRTNAFELAAFLTGQQMHYPAPMYQCLMNLLGSHDVERLRTNLATDTVLKNLSREEQLQVEAAFTKEDVERARKLEYLAIVIQFSIPGVPDIYYGDEQGMTGTNDPFNRKPFCEDDTDFADDLRALAILRRKHESLRTGSAFFIAADKDVLMILRQSDDESFLIVVNRDNREKEYELDWHGLQIKGVIGELQAVILPVRCGKREKSSCI